LVLIGNAAPWGLKLPILVLFERMALIIELLGLLYFSLIFMAKSDGITLSLYTFSLFVHLLFSIIAIISEELLPSI
jgi:hypothetical protein